VSPLLHVVFQMFIRTITVRVALSTHSVAFAQPTFWA